MCDFASHFIRLPLKELGIEACLETTGKEHNSEVVFEVSKAGCVDEVVEAAFRIANNLADSKVTIVVCLFKVDTCTGYDDSTL
jgi:hypothetical protein